MIRKLSASMIILCVALVAVAGAQTPARDITFGDFEVPFVRWGAQVGTLEVTNDAGYLKFLKIETDLRFEGEYLNPSRLERFNYILPPGEHRVITFEISVPGNFGKAMLDITVHDVVDTLDNLLPGQEVFRQTEQIRFRPKGEMFHYMQERLNVPPRVESSRDFDYELSRVLVLMLSEGRTPEEIAAFADVDQSYVDAVIDSMISRQYLALTADGPRPTFPVLTVEQVKTLKPIADGLAAQLAATLSTNLATYPGLLDSLKAAGVMSTDSNEVLDGGTVLYFRYPVVGALVLWFDLGQEFISDPRPLELFDGSDPCNAHTPRYMYLVQGAGFTGSHYYHLQISPRRFVIDWGDQVPDFECASDFYLRAGLLQDRRDWRYTPAQSPRVHVIDTSKVYPGIRHLRQGTSSFINEACERFERAASDLNVNHRHLGLRYWFWNVLATRTLNLLTEQGAVVGTGTGFYRFEGRH